MTPRNGVEKLIPEMQPGNAALMTRATYAAVAVALLLITIKAGVFFYTGSVAMMGSLIDSLLDGSASLLNLVAVRAALTPADHEHRFGHGKAEALAGLGQSIFIFGSAGFIVFESVNRLIEPQPVENTLPGIIVMVVTIAVTLGLVTYQRYVVEQTRSLAIEADSIHYRADLLMNLSVIAALVLAGVFGWQWADPIFGLVVAGLIGWSAMKIVRGAFNQLMDRELSNEDRARIEAIARAHPQVIDIHDLRTREAGTQSFIQFHLELKGDISLMTAHQISDEVEVRVMEAFPGAEVIIHQDPAGVEQPTPMERTETAG